MLLSVCTCQSCHQPDAGDRDTADDRLAEGVRRNRLLRSRSSSDHAATAGRRRVAAHDVEAAAVKVEDERVVAVEGVAEARLQRQADVGLERRERALAQHLVDGQHVAVGAAGIDIGVGVDNQLKLFD